MSNRGGKYDAYIEAILGIHYPAVPHHKRVFINTVSAPSIFHAQAIREHNHQVIQSFKLFKLMENMKVNQ
jgi:hypothetical protein